MAKITKASQIHRSAVEDHCKLEVCLFRYIIDKWGKYMKLKKTQKKNNTYCCQCLAEVTSGRILDLKNAV